MDDVLKSSRSGSDHSSPPIHSQMSLSSVITALVRKHPSLSEFTAPGGKTKLRCSLTGHEMNASLDAVQQYVEGKRYQHAAAWAAYVATPEFAAVAKHVVPHRRDPAFMWCMLTQTVLPKLPETVARHVASPRFQRALVAPAPEPAAAEEADAAMPDEDDADVDDGVKAMEAVFMEDEEEEEDDEESDDDEHAPASAAASAAPVRRAGKDVRVEDEDAAFPMVRGRKGDALHAKTSVAAAAALGDAPVKPRRRQRQAAAAAEEEADAMDVDEAAAVTAHAGTKRAAKRGAAPAAAAVASATSSGAAASRGRKKARKEAGAT